MIADFLQDLLDAGIPRAEAVRQARAELKQREEMIAESLRAVERRKKARARELRELRGW
jgi:hypothetical protein